SPVDLMEMNAERMSFPDNHFDTVCISYSIHHLENIDTVLAEMHRVLKPGGNFIIQELYSDGEQTEAQRLDKAVHNLNAKIDTILGIPHFEALTRQRLKDSVNKLGLSAVEIYESSWAVKCLFCEDAPDCAKPLTKKSVDRVKERIDDDLARIIGHPSHDELRREGASLKERAKATGSSAASVMYFFGKK
ncbi:MAG: class I SAM-dependent methyltransferase, partial [Promethearchaeota archaeon]